jgi:hypothetical protein
MHQHAQPHNFKDEVSSLPQLGLAQARSLKFESKKDLCFLLFPLSRSFSFSLFLKLLLSPPESGAWEGVIAEFLLTGAMEIIKLVLCGLCRCLKLIV